VKDELSANHLGQIADSVVITLARAGNAEAFAEIVRRCQNRVRNFMRRLCNHPDLAEDLSQQVFLKVWRSLRQLRTPAAFYGWLNRIMVSIWLEEVRRNKLNIAELDESADLEAPRNAPGERVDLDTALAQLSPAMRLCVVLAYNDGMSHPEIADATGLPLGTVKTNVSRGAAKLRSLLSDYGTANRGGRDAR
jgi:RNA polymerase sigma-70 factor (ECF subfamily)